MSSSPARGTSGSASGGPSISTTSGWYADSARRTARADPGPWCRMPSRIGLTGDSRLAGGPVEVPPAVAFPYHRLQVLPPDHLVGDRVLDDRTPDAGRPVAGAQRAVAEVGRERQPVGHHGDRLRGGQCAAG